MYTLSEKFEQEIDAVCDQWKEWWNGSIPKSVSEDEIETFYVATAINYTNGYPHMGTVFFVLIKTHLQI